MAEIILLTPEQVAEREQKPKGQGRVGRRRSPERTQIIEEYKAALQHAQPGYGGDVLLAEEEDKRTVRHNLQAAAAELGHILAFRPIRDPSRIHFRVITPEEHAARPKRGGGRPRKPAPEQPVEDGTPEEPGQELPHAEPAMLPEAPVELTTKRRGRLRKAATREAAA